MGTFEHGNMGTFEHGKECSYVFIFLRVLINYFAKVSHYTSLRGATVGSDVAIPRMYEIATL